MEDDDDETDNENGADGDDEVADRVAQMLDNQKCYIQMCKNSSQILQMLSQLNQGVSCSTQVLELQSVSEESDSSRSSTSSASSSPTSMSDEPPLVIWAEPIMTCQLISTTNQHHGCEGVRRLPPGVRPGEDKGKVSPENCSSTSSASSKQTTSPAPNSLTQKTASPAPIPVNQQISDCQGRDPETKFSSQTNFSEAMMKISKAADTIRQARQMLSCLANINELNNNNDPDQHKEISDSGHSGQARAVISTSATGAALQPKPLENPQVTDDDGHSRSDPTFPEPILVKTAVSPTDATSFTDAECSVTPKTGTDDSRPLSFTDSGISRFTDSGISRFTDSGISRSTANFPSRVNEMQSSGSPRNIERQQMSRLRANLFAERMGWSSNMSQHALQASRIVRYPRTYGPIYRRPTTEHANRTQQFSSLISQNNQEQNLPNPQTTSASEPPPSEIRNQSSRPGTIGESDASDQAHRGGGDVPENAEKVHVTKFVHKITLQDLKEALDWVLKNLGKPDCWSANSQNLNDPKMTASKVGSNGFIIAPFDCTCTPTAHNNVVTIAGQNEDETLAAVPAESDCRESPVYIYETACSGREHVVSPPQPNLVRRSHSRIWEQGGGGENENGRQNSERVQESVVETIAVNMCTSATNVCSGDSGHDLALSPKLLANEKERCSIVLEQEGEPHSQTWDAMPCMPGGLDEECGDSASCEVISQRLHKINSLGVNEGLGDVSEKEIDARSRVQGGDHSTEQDGFGIKPQSSTPFLERPLNHNSAVPDHHTAVTDHPTAGQTETASPDFVFGRHDYFFREEQWPTGRNQPTLVSRVDESSPVSEEQESSSTDGGGADIALKVISKDSRTGEPTMSTQGFQPREEKGRRRPGSAWRERQDDPYAADRSALESENGCDSSEESFDQSKATPFYVGKITGKEIIDCTASRAESRADAVTKNSLSVKTQQSISGEKLKQVELTDESGDNPLFDAKSEDQLTVQESQIPNLEAGEEGGSPDASEASSVTVQSVSIGMSISSAIKGFVSRNRVRSRPLRTHFWDRNISEFRARPAELENQSAVVESTREAGPAADEEKLEPLPNTCVTREKSNIFETADAAQETPRSVVSRSGTILKSILTRPKSPRVVPATSLGDTEETDRVDVEPDVFSFTKHSVERKVTWDATSQGSGDHVSPTVSTSPSCTKHTEDVTSHDVADTVFQPPAKPGFFQRIRRLFKACIPSWRR